MSEKLLGNWKSDLKAWAEVDPDIEEMGPMAEMMLGNLTVTFTADVVTIAGRGRGPDQVYTYTVDSDEAASVDIIVTRPDGKQGAYTIDFKDDDNVIMRMTSPKKDTMALKRG